MKKIFVVGEVGINANGNMKIVKKIIDMAKSCGCDAVKFQKRTIDNVYTKELLNSPRESPWGTTQREQKEGLEFGQEEYDEIDRYCEEIGIDWFASAWDLDSQTFLQQYNLKYNKIASPMLTYKPLLEQVAKEGKKTFISTGMSTWDEIDYAVKVFRKHNCPFVLMHCVGIYPCPDDKLNLNMIMSLKERYGVEVGYSGHSPGIMDASLAVLLGARYIEKHITLDRSMYGSDQPASLEKSGLGYVVTNVNEVLPMLGTGEKTISPEEQKVRDKLRYW